MMPVPRPAVATVLFVLAAVGTVDSSTIAEGDPGYTGDFNGVTLSGSSSIGGGDIGDGWLEAGGMWFLNGSGQAQRNTAVQYQPRGIGIAFAPPSFDGSAVLEFDYDFSGSGDFNGGSGFALLRIPAGTTSGLTLSNPVTSFGGGFANDDDLADYEVLLLVIDPAHAGDTPNETATRLLTGTSGTISESVTLDNGGADGYVFVAFANTANGPSRIDDVTLSAAAPPAPLAAPVSPEVEVQGASTILFRFLDRATDEESFDVAHREAGAATWIESTIAPSPGSETVTETAVNGLLPETTYEFRARARNSAGVSAWSPTVSGTTTAPVSASRPNIIFILADDLGPDGFGAYGSELFGTGNPADPYGIAGSKTPEVDTLAANGLVFTRAYCTGICSPSRAQYQSGQYPFLNGVLDIDGTNWYNSPHKPYLPGLLSNAGYTTGAAGKQASGGYDEYLDGKVGGYWNYHGRDMKGPSPVDPNDFNYFPDAMQAFALDFIDRHFPRAANGHKPFYFYYSLINPHVPIEHTPDSAQSDINANHLGNLYTDNIEYIDKIVGEIVDRLTTHGVLDSTLIIVTGDNGSLGGERGYRYQSAIWDPDAGSYRGIDGGKADRNQNKEGTALVPFIVHWPAAIHGARAGLRLDHLVDFTDPLVTFCELAGHPIPDHLVTHGHSFAPLLLDDPSWTPREWIYQQIENNWCVRGTDYRLNRDGRFFDMADAPFSMVEVANPTPPEQAIRDQLQAVLDDFDPANGPTYEAHQDIHFNQTVWDWKRDNWTYRDRYDTNVSGDLADPDFDGVLNIFERGFGWNLNNGTDVMPSVYFASGYLRATYPAPLPPGASETVIGIEVTGALDGAWDSSSGVVETTGSGTLQSRDRTAPALGAPRFMRFRAERATPWDEP